MYAYISLYIFVFWFIHSFLTFPDSRNLHKGKDSTLHVPHILMEPRDDLRKPFLHV